MAAQHMQLCVRSVPNLDRSVGTAPDQSAVRAERHAQRRPGGVGQIMQQLPVRRCPDFDGPVPAGRGQPLAIWAECYAYDATGRLSGVEWRNAQGQLFATFTLTDEADARVVRFVRADTGLEVVARYAFVCGN